MTTGTVLTNGHPSIIAPPGGQTTIQGASGSTFNPFTLTDADMQVLKAYAKAHGTYYQGSQSFTSPPPNGLLFFDTASGNPLTSSSPASDGITISINGNWSQGWNGWMIIAGAADISGNITMTGLIYAQNDVHIHGNGNEAITGAVIAQGRADPVSSTIDDVDIGNGRPQRWRHGVEQLVHLVVQGGRGLMSLAGRHWSCLPDRRRMPETVVCPNIGRSAGLGSRRGLAVPQTCSTGLRSGASVGSRSGCAAASRAGRA